jgi:hypothetical protein
MYYEAFFYNNIRYYIYIYKLPLYYIFPLQRTGTYLVTKYVNNNLLNFE